MLVVGLIRMLLNCELAQRSRIRKQEQMDIIEVEVINDCVCS